MSPVRGITVIVLAAGKSSRMGTSKSLLPLGSTTALERLIGSVSRAQICDIIVVTGHDPERIAPVLSGLPVRRVHNAEYESGMFSSARTGVMALGDEVEAFMILPADYPLIRPEVLDRLIDEFRQSEYGLLHPACCGLRGHPPVLAGRYRGPLLEADGRGSLQDFLWEHYEDEVEIEVDDLSILLDMDTDDDYRRMCRFAGFLDKAADSAAAAATDTMFGAVGGAVGGAASSPGAGNDVVATDDALYLLALLEVPNQTVRHCQTVAMVGERLAQALKPHVPGLDVDLVRAAGLLHDMAKVRPKHALVAQNILFNLGLARLGAVVGAHMVLPPEQLRTPSVTEEQVIYLADKLVIEDRIAGFEQRAARALSRKGPDPAMMEGVRTRMGIAQAIQDKIETILQRPLDEVLLRERRSSI